MTMKRVVFIALRLVAVAYAAAIVWMVAMQTRMVFPGAFIERDPALHLPAIDDLAWDTLRVQADDGTSVVLLLSLRPDMSADSPWVLFFHGNGGLVGSRGSAERYLLLHEAGFNVVAVEYRGYGVSSDSGSPSEAGLYSDARAAWSHLSGSLGVEGSEVVLYGWSLGAGLATHLALDIDPAGIVTEGAFTSIPDVGAALYPWLPVRLLARHRFRNIERAPQLDSPWLVFHASADEVIPFEHAEALSRSAPNTELIPLGGGHDDAVLVDRGKALAALGELAEHVRGGG